jgi:hypothetical protein
VLAAKVAGGVAAAKLSAPRQNRRTFFGEGAKTHPILAMVGLHNPAGGIKTLRQKEFRYLLQQRHV